MWCKIFIVIYILLIVQTQKATSNNPKPKVDEKKLKEIAEIRNNLNEAFEKDMNMQLSGKGAIVQPDWTHGEGKNKGFTKVVVTDKKLKDAAAIRDEIKNAVASDTYVSGQGFNAAEADHYLGIKYRSKNVLDKMTGSTKNTYDQEEVGYGLQEETEPGTPNVIETSALDDVDIDKLKQLKMKGRRTREVLVLREIVEDLSFELGEDVREWEHFEHNGQEYFIGRREIDLVVVQKDAMKYEKGQLINVGAPIMFLESFSFWNIETKQQEGLILVVVDERVLWYQVNSAEDFWQWSAGVLINGVRHFKIDQKEYLAIYSNQSSRTGYASLNIYQFDLKLKEFWIAQKLQLESLCSEVIFLDTGRDMVLAVVQNNSAAIFTFNPRSDIGDHLKFELKTTIQSEGIQSVSGFRMGGYSYLALGGLNPQILQYANGEFVQKTIFGQNFGLVEMFLPVPARTYRDDLILLVQHRVDFDSHGLVVLETLIWDGEAFEATIPAPCTIGNHTFAHGVGCMLDVQRESGIKGSAILKRNNDIFIIVPRYKAESGLFQIKTELLAKNSELLDLREVFAFLMEWVKEQEDLAEEAHKFLSEHSGGSTNEADPSSFTTIKTPELDFNGDIGQIFVNEYELKEQDMQVDLENLIGAIERLDIELGHDDVLRNRRELTYDTLDFNNIDADELDFQLLNGEPSYLKNSELIFDGAVTFESLKVFDEIRLSSARFMRDDSMEVGEDLEFNEINGIQWKELMDDVVFRNSPSEIVDLQVNGEVIIESDIQIQTLNGLKFPEDYLWSSGPLATVVHAEKKFLGDLVANAVDTGGLINGVNPFDVITLSEAETISGLTTFTQLEVSERMEVNGVVQGRGLTDFLSNPSLLDTNIIHSACTFHHLEVRGPILVSQNYNGNDLDATLSDVVYRPSTPGEQISIGSKKSFNTILFGPNLKLEDNSLSGIPLSTFFTRNTKQELALKNITGNVYFNNLTLTGQYDSVDISQLVRNSVNLEEDRNLDLEVEFADGIWAQSIEIVESLNGQTAFRTLQDDFVLEEASFNDLSADTVTSDCDLTGEGTLNNINFKLGKSDQDSKVYVNELILETGLQVATLHNISAKFLLSFLEQVDNIPAMILEGKLLVDHIHVDGDIQVNKLNAHSFDEDIQMNAIWLNRPNYLQIKVEFQNPLTISGDLNINGSLNELDFPKLVEDIAFKSESTIVVTAAKRFLADFKVTGDVHVESVNGVPFTEIATTQTMERFEGSVYINGDLVVESLEITGFLNDYEMGSFGKSYHYDEVLKTIVLLGEVIFEEHLNLEDLFILGHLNSIGNVNEFFENIVYKNKICMLKGKTTFTGNVTIEKGAYIRHVNGYNVAQLMRNIVFINDPEPIFISAPVVFKGAIQAKDVTVKGSLEATTLMGCRLDGWLKDTLRVDRSTDIKGRLHFAPGVLDGSSLHTVFLNGMDMENVITLYTPQTIFGHVNFSSLQLKDSIDTDGLVNGINLQQEMEDTLMINGNQHISTPLTMESCTVIRSLETNNIVNEAKDLRNLATLHDNIDFRSPISFSQVTAGNVFTDDLISGIDFNRWHQNSLWRKGRHSTIVTGNWTVNDLYVESPTNKDELVNGMQMDDMKKALKQPNDEILEQYEQIYDTYAGLCQRSKNLFKKAQNRIYFLKHFEKSFSIKEEQNINGIFSLVDGSHNYLIVNIGCESKIFAWAVESGVFTRISEFDSGVIKEIVAVPSKDDTLHLVTNVKNRNHGCSRLGVNSWHFDHEKVSHLRSFNDSDISMIHHTSQSADNFYAIDEKIGKIVQLTPNSTDKLTWNLPPSDSGLYRFLPQDADLGIALANGQQILLLNTPSRHRLRSKRDSLFRRRAQLKFETRSELPADKELSFSDFRHVIERILRDLIRRLNIQLTDINFTISEGDHHDEHLERDLMDILKEIQEQKILPSDTFTDLHVDQMEFSSNPVQMLAARVIQVIWPVLGEVEEVHSHLRNDEHDHPICSSIFKSLTSVVHDIIQTAKFYKKNGTDYNVAANFTQTTGRIQKFQKEILEIIDTLDQDAHGHEQLTDISPSSPEAPAARLNITVSNPLDEPFIGQAIPDRNLLAANSPHLPARGAGEIVSIKTGMSGNHRTLIAITEPKDHVIASENDAVKIFFDVITGSLFQTLSAYKPNCLTATRIQDESLLAFVEDKHMVRVFVYKGIRGFVEFVKFKVEVAVSEMKFISLPAKKENGCPNNFLMINGGYKVDFYEAVMTGNCGLRDELECSASESY